MTADTPMVLAARLWQQGDRLLPDDTRVPIPKCGVIERILVQPDMVKFDLRDTNTGYLLMCGCDPDCVQLVVRSM